MTKSIPFARNAMHKSARAVAVCGLSASLLFSVGCRAQQPWPLWTAYSAKYLDGQGRVIDHSAGDRSTTEGEAYAMFFALVTNDESRFDKLLAWTESNMAAGDLTLHLPAWDWGQASDGSWHTLDTNSAADADLWMAYTLCQAGRLWHVDRYTKLGLTMERLVAQQEVVLTATAGAVVIPGEQGFHPTPTSWYVNPSYTPPFILAYFAHVDPSSPWSAVLASLPNTVQTSGGFAMDWMNASAEAGMVPSAPPSVLATLPAGQNPPVPVGSFDAIRVYLWAGMADSKTPHVREELANLHGMAAYLNGHTAPPMQAGPEGQVLNPDGPAGFSAAVIPYLQALQQTHTREVQVTRLGALLDPKSGLYGKDGAYYDQNLVMFEDGWINKRFSFGQDGEVHLKWK